MTENEDFKFRDDLVGKPEDTVKIELLLEPFKGIVYNYNNMQIIEPEKEGDDAVMRFDYTIFLTNDKYTITQLYSDKKFQQTIGLVLNSMLIKLIEATDGNTDSNFKESDGE